MNQTNMGHLAVTFILSLLYALYRARKGKRFPKRPRDARPLSQRVFSRLGSILRWTAIMLIFFGIGVGSFVFAARTLMSPKANELFFGTFWFAVFLPALIFTFVTFIVSSDFLGIVWNRRTPDQKIRAYQNFAIRARKKRWRFVLPLLAGAVCISSFLFAITGMKLGPEGLQLQLGLRRTIYPLSDVVALEVYQKRKDVDGAIKALPGAEIKFRDGYIWFSDTWDFALDRRQAKSLVEYISKETGIPIREKEVQTHGL